MVTLRTAEAKEPLFQDGIAAIPQGQRETEATLTVTDPQQAIFTPAAGTAAGMIMREVGPGRTIGRVVFPYRAPLPLRLSGCYDDLKDVAVKRL
jgi:hypothetical protein